MEIKKEDFVKFHIVDTVFYALPVKFFNQAKYEEIEIVAEAEILIKKKQVEKAKKEAELAEKKRVAEEKLKEQQDLEARQKAAEDMAKAIEAEKAEAEKLKTDKKAELLKEIEDLEA